MNSMSISSRVQMVRASTAGSPNEGVTSGSLSIQQSGRALRHACAEVRQIFLRQRGGSAGRRHRRARHRGRHHLRPRQCQDQLLGTCRRSLAGSRRDAGRSAEDRRRSARWPEIRFSGWIFPTRFSRSRASSTIRRCRGCCMAACCGRKCPRAKLVELKEDGARAVAGLVAIVRDGSFAGVVSETEHGAEAALKALAQGRDMVRRRAAARRKRSGFVPESPAGGIDRHRHRRRPRQPGTRARTIRRQYTRPYIAHASIAPSCAMAQWNGDRVHVWTHSQGVYLLRADLALVLKLPVENITVEHMEGAGCYGHNAADDVALDAVLLAKAAGGRPVRVQWSRAGRDVACAVRRGDGDRDRGRSRRAGRNRRLAALDLGQRPRRAAGTRGAACAAGGDPNWQIRFRA